MKQTTEEHFDDVSRDYEKYISFLVGYDEIIEKIERLSNVKEDYTVVDVGTGIGRLSITLASKVKKVVAIDISNNMIERAKKESIKNNISNIEFKRTSCMYLPVVNSSVDLIVSNLVLHHLTDEEKFIAMKEFYRVLKSKGIIIIGDLMESKITKGEILDMIKNYRDRYGTFETVKILLKIIKNRLFVKEYPASPEKWNQILSNVGFKQIRIERIRGPLWVLYGIKS